jgi:2-polyprenyl-3-methyl-5-hydroxy-6-metoxy-1,4-benzoquinol methylase
MVDEQPVYSRGAHGIYTPRTPVVHRDEEYDPAGFDILRDMQRRHFWYAGRHRFLLHVLRAYLKRISPRSDGLKAIDLGGGCGGWVSYLRHHLPQAFSELALSDSSLQALSSAGPVVGEGVGRYQIDLLDLLWHDRWDVAFLLDVLEHIPADEQALRQIWLALRPGGLLFVTTPALQVFWTYNDDLVHHVRRYSRADFARLAGTTGFECCLTRYFMFFLSPVLLLSRRKRLDASKMTREQITEQLKRTHRVPPAWANGLLTLVFAAETPVGHWLAFPWGASVLGVFRKPLESKGTR